MGAVTAVFDSPPGVRVTWLARNGVPHGERLIPEMRATVRRLLGNQVPAHDTDLEDAPHGAVSDGGFRIQRPSHGVVR